MLLIASTLALAGAYPRNAQAQGAGPTTVSQAAFPITVNGAEYSLVQVILEFAPGAGVPRHQHGGPAVVTVLAGEITLQEQGTERTMKAGESWTERPGATHAVINRGNGPVRVAVGILLPKGAEATTLLPQ